VAAVQLDQTDAAEVATTAMSAVQSVLDKIPLDATLDADHVSLLSEFVSSGDTTKYAPQSATIMGILTDMYVTFAKNLQDATVKEMQQNKAYEEATDTDDATIKGANDIKTQKEKLKAKDEVDLAATTSTYDSTFDQKKANVKFFDDALKSCSTKHAEYKLRTKLRAEEKKGIEEAIGVLTSSSSRASFAKSSSTKASAAASFLQFGESQGSEGSEGSDSGVDANGDSAELNARLTQVDTNAKEEAEQSAKESEGWRADAEFFAMQEMKNKPKDAPPPNSVIMAAGALKHFVTEPAFNRYQKALLSEVESADKEEQKSKNLRSGKTLKDAKGALASAQAIMASLKQKTKDDLARKKEEMKPRFNGQKEGSMDADQQQEYFNSKKNQILGNGESDANEPNFLQIGEESDVEAVTRKAYKLIQSRASKSQSLRLAMLAVHMRTAKAGHFDTVITEIDNMVVTLATEGKADKAKKDQCKVEFSKINKKVKDLTWKLTNNGGVITDDKRIIHSDNVTEIDCWNQVNASAAFRAKITNDRNTAHTTWQTEGIDDTTAINLLTLSKKKLTAFYDAQKVDMGPMEAPVMIQAAAPVFDRGDAAPDATLSKKDDNKGAKKAIVSLMDYIIEDLKSEIAEDKVDEAEEVAEWQTAIAAALDLEQGLKTKINTLDGHIALISTDKTEESGKKLTNEQKLKAIKAYEANIKPDCDWMVKNFEGRAKARLVEHDGLIEAKELLAGKLALLQSSKTVEKHTNVVDSLRNINFLSMRT